MDANSSGSQEVMRELARTLRIASRLDLVDLLGHASVLMAGGDAIAVTPGHGSGKLPGFMRTEDILMTDLDGKLLSANGFLPLGYELDLAIFRLRPDVRAILTAAPQAAMLRAIAGRAIRAVSHSQSHIVHQGVAVARPERFPVERSTATVLAEAMGGSMVLQMVGIATVVADSSMLGSLKRCHDLESLARLTDVAEMFGTPIREISEAESEAVVAQRPVEAVPSRDPRRYYESLDTVAERDPVDPDIDDDLKARIALACRTLATKKTLVAYFEHVSHRIPGEPDKFMMSPAKNFSDMTAEDIGVVSTTGNCEWLEGPYPPAPFRWYHRDLLAARPDVNAIVHTHELHGRASVMAGQQLRPIHRTGALLALQPLPVFQTPTLGFLPEHRSDAIRLLGDGKMVHLLSHGTDYLAPTIEEATVNAIHREELARTSAMAARLGETSPLSPGVLEDLAALGPSHRQWWAYYASALV